MNVHLTLAIITAVILGGGETRFIDLLQNATNQSPKGLGLEPICSIEGKRYFISDDKRTWAQSKEYCASLNMRLATITSANQATCLDNGYTTAFAGFFWIDGRDAKELRQFSWDFNGGQIGEYLKLGNSLNDGYKTCLTYDSHPGLGTSDLDAWNCDRAFQAICENLP